MDFVSTRAGRRPVRDFFFCPLFSYSVIDIWKRDSLVLDAILLENSLREIVFQTRILDDICDFEKHTRARAQVHIYIYISVTKIFFPSVLALSTLRSP